jgi:hypothetical protein
VRDYHVRGFFKPVALPPQYDFVENMNPRRNQYMIGSCVAFSVANGLDCLISIRDDTEYLTSPHFIYALRANSPSEGMEPRDALDIVHKNGCPPESDCPYNMGLNINSPCNSPQVLKDAQGNKIGNYARIYSIIDMKQTLYQKCPKEAAVVLAVPVYSNWNNVDALLTGNIPDPPQNEIATEGHQIVLCGYDDETGRFIFENSWTEDSPCEWAPNSKYGCGIGTISYAYVQQSINLGIGESWAFFLESQEPDHVCPDGQHWDDTEQACVPDEPQPQPDPTQCYANFLTDLEGWSGNLDMQLFTALINLFTCLAAIGTKLSPDQTAKIFKMILDRAKDQGKTNLSTFLSRQDYVGLFALGTLILTALIGLISTVLPSALPIFTYFSGLATSEAKDYFEHKRQK